jgi:AraC-like DNA-binding protein
MYSDEEKIKASEKLVPCVIRKYEHSKAFSSISEMVESCKSEANISASLSALKLSAFLIEAGEMFADAGSVEPEGCGSDSVAAEVLEYLSLNYSSSETSKVIAGKYHLSESQLRRRFVSAYGMPPIAYRCALRCKIAAELLSRTSASVSEITSYMPTDSVFLVVSLMSRTLTVTVF